MSGSPRTRVAFTLFHWTLALVVAWQSVQTVRETLSERVRDPLPLSLGSLEAVAALLLLHPRTLRMAGTALLVIFALALVLHALRGQFPSTLLVYAAGVWLVMAHSAADREA